MQSTSLNRDHTVAVLGASIKPERYSYKAFKLLLERGYKVIPVNPAGITVEGIISKKSVVDIEEDVDTLTLYVNPKITDGMIQDIVDLSPGRVIMNPGTENPRLKAACEKADIEVIEACTIVMLKTDQF